MKKNTKDKAGISGENRSKSDNKKERGIASRLIKALKLALKAKLFFIRGK